MNSKLLLGLAAGAAGVVTAAKGRERLALSRAKHRSLTGHVRLAERVAGQVLFYAYEDDRFFDADGAGTAVAVRRRAGFERLVALYAERHAGGGLSGATAAQRRRRGRRRAGRGPPLRGGGRAAPRPRDLRRGRGPVHLGPIHRAVPRRAGAVRQARAAARG